MADLTKAEKRRDSIRITRTGLQNIQSFQAGQLHGQRVDRGRGPRREGARRGQGRQVGTIDGLTLTLHGLRHVFKWRRLFTKLLGQGVRQKW